ncbi:NlpC (ORF-17) [Salmonella enterica subsp. enterica serovar Heidelberg str. CVM24388]|nr:NlpC (ORF-17) [Salmonella enterica subsp. enterica serovar Heidelberg str. CVM24388]
MRFWLLVITALFLAGCSTHRAPAPNARLSDSITVIAGLNDQLQSWRGTPYRYGGMSRRGVDCSGFVVVTMRDKFDLQLPRDTREQSKIGTRIDKDELLPGDLVSLKPVRAKVVYMLVFTIQIMSLFMPLPVVA